MVKLLKGIKSKLSKKDSYITWTGKRYNPNHCYYCGEIIGEGRFSFHKGKHFHKACVKKWHDNKRQRLTKAREVYANGR